MDHVHLSLAVPEQEHNKYYHQTDHCSQRKDGKILYGILSPSTPQSQHLAVGLCQIIRMRTRTRARVAQPILGIAQSQLPLYTTAASGTL